MTLSNAEKQRQRRENFKAEGLIHIQGWVTPEQAEVIRAIMANQAVSYEPRDPPPSNPGRKGTSGNNHKKLRFKKKPDHPGAWIVYWGHDELGTVYKRSIDEESKTITVWMAYRYHGRSSRHVTRQHAGEALLNEYRGL